MKGRPITDQGARALAAAVALQACLDWRLLQQVVSGARRPWPVNGLNMSQPQEEIRKLEAFFLNGWYETLTDHRGDVALALLQRDERTKRHARIGRQGHQKRKPGWNIDRSWSELKDTVMRDKLIQLGIYQKDVAREMGICCATLHYRMCRGLKADDLDAIREIIRSKGICKQVGGSR